MLQQLGLAALCCCICCCFLEPEEGPCWVCNYVSYNELHECELPAWVLQVGYHMLQGCLAPLITLDDPCERLPKQLVHHIFLLYCFCLLLPLLLLLTMMLQGREDTTTSSSSSNGTGRCSCWTACSCCLVFSYCCCCLVPSTGGTASEALHLPALLLAARPPTSAEKGRTTHHAGKLWQEP